MQMILEPLYKAKIPVFSQTGPSEVKYGCTLGMSQASYQYEANFYASVVARIFNGEKPRDIRQIFEEPQKITINQKVLDKIKKKIPQQFQKYIDEVFVDISNFMEQ
jgi:ABC-type uncharacterized transport system substrate-binding protein